MPSTPERAKAAFSSPGGGSSPGDAGMAERYHDIGALAAQLGDVNAGRLDDPDGRKRGPRDGSGPTG